MVVVVAVGRAGRQGTVDVTEATSGAKETVARQGYGSPDLVTRRGLVVVRQQPDLEEHTDLEFSSAFDNPAPQMGPTYAIEWRTLLFSDLPLQTSQYVHRGVAYLFLETEM